MALSAGRVRPAGRPRPQPSATWLRWWIAPTPSVVWRFPLLLILGTLGAWFVFRGLVHLAFLFFASVVLSVVFGFVLLPLAALPAFCFWFALRTLPRIWRDPAINRAVKTLNTVLIVPVSLLVASFIDFVETVSILRMGIRLPRLPFDLF